jgi:phospholipid-binding lipoprotein MlaA
MTFRLCRGQAMRAIGVAAFAVLAVGCAEVPKDPAAKAAYNEANDPLEPMNRAIFDFNMAADRAVLKPVAKAYRWTLPEFFRTSIRNFLNNAKSPVIFINDSLQGSPSRAGETLMRFIVNTTAGMGGIFDVAGEYGMERHSEDFGQTLAVWGVGEGAYLMLPVLGPSNVRDTVGRVADGFMDPFGYLLDNNGLDFARIGAVVTDGIDQRSRNIESLDDIERNSLDFYATLRSLYRQNRNSEILNGKVQDIPVPEIREND